MSHDLEILPQKGLGNIVFNNSIDVTVQKLGQPDHIEEIDGLDDENSMAYFYDKYHLIAFFEGLDNMVLTILETKDPNITLFGEKVFDLDENEIHKLMKDHGYEEIDTEMVTWGGKRISFEEANMDFYFENDKLTAINWGCFLGEERNTPSKN
ncbi:MAG: hypothetical protein ACQESX_03380 [Bacteroidota bacterium]